MIVGTCKVYFRADWIYSLKEKRSAVKNIIEKTKNRFNVSIAEIEDQDIHRSIVVGFACVSNGRAHIDSVIQNVVEFMDRITDAVIVEVLVEIL